MNKGESQRFEIYRFHIANDYCLFLVGAIMGYGGRD
jgi:hypothetical protein